MPSPFASMTASDRIPLPFDEGQWVRVRALTGAEYEAVQASHRREFAAGGSRSWALTFRRMLEMGPKASDPAVLKALHDPLTGHDRYEIARLGLIEWSYPLPIARVEGREAVPATETTPAQPAVEAVDAVGDLLDTPIDFIARLILEKTKPELFIASEDAEAAQKNG